MAKNKGTYGKAKSDVEVEDEFIASAGKVATTLSPHRKKLVVLLSLVLLVAVGVATWDWYQKKQTRKLTAEVDGVIELLHAPIAGDEGTAAEGTFPTEEARDSAVLAAFGKLAGGSSSPSLRAAKLLEAESLMNIGKYDEAIASYRAFLQAKVPEALRVSAREGIGYALEAKALGLEDAKARSVGLEEALVAFGQMQPDVAGAGHKRALYHEGRILASLERRDDAIAKYRAILDSDPGSLEAEVENRLAALEDKSAGK